MFVVVMLVVIALSACSGSGSGDGGEDGGQDSGAVSGGGTSDQDAGTVAPSPADEECTEEEFPQRLDLQTDDPQEVPYLEQMVACTDSAESATLLINNSDAVWTLATDGGGATVDQLTSSARLVSFRGALATEYQYDVLAPESSLIVHAAPSRTTWTLSPGFSAMWLAHEKFADTVQKYGESQLTDMLSGRSLRRKALITCSIAGWHVAGDKAERLTGPNPTEQWLAGLGIAAETTTCARAWLAADDQALRRFGSTATWQDDVARLARNTTFISHADEELTLLRRLGQLAAHVRPP